MPDARNNELRKGAREAFRSGHIEQAIKLQCELVNSLKSSRIEPDDLKFLSFLFYSVGDIKQSLVALEQYLSYAPNDVEALTNKAHILMRYYSAAEAFPILQLALKIDPNHDTCLSMLAEVFYLQGHLSKAREIGLRALEIRANSADNSDFDPSKVPVPPFREDARERNVISFSLWGAKERYLSGALRNATLAADIYPAWTCRFYVDNSVPNGTLDALRDAGADLVVMPPPTRSFDGLFWRFFVADDVTVERYLIRDADSVINTQERVAVDAWIASGRHFHVMRDWWTHTEPILAGMWGGVSNSLPPFRPMINNFIADSMKRSMVGRIIDQVFLRTNVWPIVRLSVLQHDSVFRFGGADDFPDYGRRGPGMHVGQDDMVFQERLKSRVKGRTLSPGEVGISA
jgi:hypothetical protein